MTATALSLSRSGMSVWNSPGDREAEVREGCYLHHPNLCPLKPALGVLIQSEFPSTPSITGCAPGTLKRYCHLNALSPFLSLDLCTSCCLCWTHSCPLPVSGPLLLNSALRPVPSLPPVAVTPGLGWAGCHYVKSSRGRGVQCGSQSRDGISGKRNVRSRRVWGKLEKV